MAFSWDGRYVLRRIEETDPTSHRIYWHSSDPATITDAINVIDRGPVKASRALYDATSVNPPTPWLVKLQGVDERVLMGVFQLNRI